MEISQKWLGEGAKGVLDPGSKGLPRVFCTTQTLFCTGATLFCTSARRLGTLGPKHLLHPLLTTFRKFPFSGPLPEPWGRKSGGSLESLDSLESLENGLFWKRPLSKREALCESGRWIDALKKRGRDLKKRGRVLKKRGRVLKKRRFVRGTGGGPLLQKGGGWLLQKGGGGFLRSLWRSLRSSTPSRRPSLCLPNKFPKLGCRKWGCNKWGFKGCLAALPRNRPKSAFFALFLPFSPFSGGCEEHLENPENGGKRPFSSDILRFA